MREIIQRATPRNRLLPRNGKHLPPVQLFSNEVRLVTVSPNGAPGHFDAVIDGELMVASSRQPFTDTARVLLDRGVDSNSWLIQRHAGSDVDALRGKVGIAAKLTVKEPDRGQVHFARYVPFGPSPVAPRVAQSGKSNHPVVTSAERV